MGESRHLGKIISVYSNINVHGKAEYALNLAAALVRITQSRVMLINASRAIGPEAGIDVSGVDQIKKQYIEEVKNNYQYIIINLPVEHDESLYKTLSCSDAIHLFVDSTRDGLENAYRFLEEMLKKGLEDARNKVKVVVSRLSIFDKFSLEEMSWLLRADVWAIVPEPGITDLLIDLKGIPLVLKSESSAYAKAVVLIAKREAGKLLGMALGSGAAIGLAHIGVLKVLEKNQIVVDVISGSSIGALIASMWGLGFSSDKMERIARKLRKKLNIMRLLDFTMPISGILAGKRLRRFLRSILREKRFEDLQIPVKIMVYDLANRETLAIERGTLVDAVYKSIAVPGIFEPKMESGRMIVDGGVSDPVPVDILLKDGVKKIIAVNVLPGPEDMHKRNMLLKKRLSEEESLMRNGRFYIKLGIRIRNFFRKIFTPNIFDVIMTSMQSLEYTLGENSCKKADVVLHPVFADATSVDFHLVGNFIRTAEEETNEHIEEIKALTFR